MAKLQPNTLIGILRGKLGDIVFVQNEDGTVTVRHTPIRRAEFKELELSNQRRFTEAAAYVKSVRQDPEAYAVYQKAARLRRKRACNLANADFYHPPAIVDVELSGFTGQVGETIHVEATDDFEVRMVCLTITNLDGLLLELGTAIHQKQDRWIYTMQNSFAPGQTVIMHVTASDRPGNVARKTFHWALLPIEPPREQIVHTI